MTDLNMLFLSIGMGTRDGIGGGGGAPLLSSLLLLLSVLSIVIVVVVLVVAVWSSVKEKIYKPKHV